MTRDSRYDILFEPVQIGPKQTKNRFYQVPHCTGMGTNMPNATARFREIKAEGGWGVVNTEMCCIHETSDISPFSQEKIWSDEDLPGLQLMVDAVHRHGALAGVELAHEGADSNNRMTRERPMSASPRFARAMATGVRQMDKADILNLRKWHRTAALRSRSIGFDIIYVYASALSLPVDFLTPRVNRRDDEYGGVIENRARLLRELLEDTKDAVGADCAVAIRFGTDEVLGDQGYTCNDDGRRVVEILAEIPDLWDVNVNNSDFDMSTARFADEGYQEPFISFVKQVTSKPVVGVGRYTSPDRMVSLIRKGMLDLIGAARPSIADPFLPNKIRDGRIEDIRECIGCNMCLSMQYVGGPIRCTQNPTTGEEWRRGWHPEKLPKRKSDTRILVIGGGPAGLEAAVSLGKRGYEVALAEKGDALGGRAIREAALPGLSTYRRVADYRIGQLHKLPNVEFYLGSAMSAEDLTGSEFDRIVVATGAEWLKNGIGRVNRFPVPGHESPHVYTPDDVMDGQDIPGPVVIYDEENYYCGGVIAEHLVKKGRKVTLVTPEVEASTFLRFTGERSAVQKRLLSIGIDLAVNHTLARINHDTVDVACVHTGRCRPLEAQSVIMVGLRMPRRQLADEIEALQARAGKPAIVSRIGDAWSPGTIAEAVFSGHKLGRELDEPIADELPYLVERPVVLPLDRLTARNDF